MPINVHTYLRRLRVNETSAVRFAQKRWGKTSNAVMQITHSLVFGTNFAIKSVFGSAVRALLIETAKSPFSNPLMNGNCSYNDQCSVLSKMAFVQIGPQTCKQVQKGSGSGSGRFFKGLWNATHKTQQGSTPPTHLAPGKHAQTPTTHAH